MVGEMARHWRHPGLPGVDLLKARYVTYRFGKHIHRGYAIGLIESGVEEWHDERKRLVRAGPGTLGLVNPEIVHTGYAGVPEGWSYRVTYPSTELVREIAAELGAPAGTPIFSGSVVDDPDCTALMRAAHRAAEQGDSLAASSLLRAALARLISRHSHARVADGLPRPAEAPAVREAREILHESLVDPPSLEELARTVGSSPFALLRAFRTATGLPPHAYLNQIRVDQARGLLEAGMAPAEVSVATGFADQAHLTRHFKRAVGVPPRAYQRERSVQ